MPVSIASVVLHVADIESATAFWAKALAPGYDLVHQDHNSSTFSPESGGGVTLQLNSEDRTHLDLNTRSEQERVAETERLLSVGASRVDWPYRADITVLADPSGNRFCVV